MQRACCAAQIYAGRVVELTTGVNTLGGTPIKPMGDRERGGDQLREDMEKMNPAVTPEVEGSAGALHALAAHACMTWD
jgi:hypothetical protein